MDVDGKTELRAKRFELGHSGLGSVAKAEVAALMHAAHAQSVHQYAARKLPRRQRGQRGIEGQHHHRVNAGEAQKAQPFADRRKQPRRLSRAKKLIRMRVECDGQGPSAY